MVKRQRVPRTTKEDMLHFFEVRNAYFVDTTIYAACCYDSMTLLYGVSKVPINCGLSKSV